MEVIVSHVNIDFDGLASLLAAKKLYPQAIVALTDMQQPAVKSFLAIYREELNFSSFEKINWQDVRVLILVDVASIKRTGVPTDKLSSFLHTIVYDHHASKTDDLTGGELYIENVGSAITLLTEELIKQEVPISPFEATLFGLGLYTDTGNFIYPQVTSRDLYVGSMLMEYGMDVSLIEDFSEQVLTSEDKLLFQTLLTGGKEQQDDGLSIFVTMHEQETYQGGLATLTQKLIETTNTDAVISIVKMKKHVYVVTRASSPRIDFRPLMETLGGGGHAQAASATVKNSDLSIITKSIQDSIHTIIKPAIKASSIMASPVKYVSPTDKIEMVLKQMFYFGHTGFPVVNENGNLVGVISRRDVDKATNHGLGHAPVKGYMSDNPITLGLDASLEEIQSTMMIHNIGRIPIVNNGKMVGILTRTNVIEQLHKQIDSNNNQKITPTQMVKKMKELLPSSTFILLEQVGQIADEKNLDVYLIGGIVRDFFLHRQNEDIDLVVEGNGIEFAKELAIIIGGEVKTHETFGTATWTTPSQLQVDIVTCRTEYYDSPGVLPTIRASNIQEDLRRRDFTINAMALRINKSHFGEVIDDFQGQKDIDAKLIRILHTLSFIEDPTRIFRGVRFALRFDYQFAKQTKILALDAAPMLKQVSPIRIYREIELLIAERSTDTVMHMLNELGVWNALFNLEPSHRAWERFNVLISHELTEPYHFITALLYDEDDWKNKVSPYLLTTHHNKLISQVEQLSSLNLSNKKILSDLHDALYDFSIDSIYLFALLTESELLLTYIDKRKQLTILLSGKDLIELKLKPGPYFSVIQHKLFCLQLNEQIHTKEEAIQWLFSKSGILN